MMQKIMQIWPNFFIVGASRAGTTSLYNYLKKIPEVYMCPEKEPHYFSRVTQGRFKVEDEKTYLELFKGVKNEKAIGEASTSYIRSRVAPKLIHDKLPHSKIIIILRDPIDQLISSYFFNLQQRALNLSLHEAVLKGRIDENGNSIKQNEGYSVQINRYLEIFGSDQVMIIIFEEFIKKPQDTVKQVLKFLGINYNFIDFKTIVYNPSLVLNYEKLNENDKEMLSKFFEDEKLNENDKEMLSKFFEEDVKKLESILGLKLPWPNFKNKNSKAKME